MPNIRPIKDLRNTVEISELCHQTDEPVFITKNGYNDMVIMSNEVYEKLTDFSDIIRQLSDSLKEINTGRGKDGTAVLERMRDKYKYDV